MATDWQYLDENRHCVRRVLDNGGTESTLASNLPEGTIIQDPPYPTFEDYANRYELQFDNWIEDVAKSNGYRSSLSCVSYERSGVAQYAGDARAMLDWRDALYKWLQNWQLGFNGQLPNPIPSFESIKAQAPQPEDFGWTVHDKTAPVESQLPPEDATI